MTERDTARNVRQRLAEKLTDESEAYGFSLTTWGVGALVVARFGVPGVRGVISLVAGAVTGFALLASVAFDRFLAETEVSDESLFVASTVHVASTLGTVLACQVVIDGLAGTLPRWGVLFLVGVLVTALYNGLLMAEEFVARLLK